MRELTEQQYNVLWENRPGAPDFYIDDNDPIYEELVSIGLLNCVEIQEEDEEFIYTCDYWTTNERGLLAMRIHQSIKAINSIKGAK